LSHSSLSRGAWASLAWLALGVVTQAHAAPADANTPESETNLGGKRDKFIVPKKPLILTRIIRRSLVDGQVIMAHRSYDIHFTPENGGYRIDGQLQNVMVEAPPKLAALASLERNRRDDAIFPLYINAYGQLTSPQLATPNTMSQTAAGIATTMAENEPMGPQDHQNITEIIDQITKMSGSMRSVWPNDLFRPATGVHSETKIVTLPNGDQGKITIRLEAKTSDDGGLLQSLERTIITETDGTQRQSQELWTLGSQEDKELR
jgi:hypothetical protein